MTSNTEDYRLLAGYIDRPQDRIYLTFRGDVPDRNKIKTLVALKYPK